MSSVPSIQALVPSVPLMQAVEINPKPDREPPRDDALVSFVPMAAVGASNGQIDTSAVRPYREVKKGYTRFRDGDVLFAKVTPCMENGKMAVARGLAGGLGFGSTEFHVLRPRDGVAADYIYYFVSSERFRRDAARHMTGAVGLRRVPSAFLESAEIPLPSFDAQRLVVAEIEKQFSRLDDSVAGLESARGRLVRYRRSILDAAIQGRLVENEAELSQRLGISYESGADLLERILAARSREWKERGIYKAPERPSSTESLSLPKGWAWATLGQTHLQIADVDHKMPKAEPNGVPYVSTKDFVGDEAIDFSRAKRISKSSFEALCRKVRPEKGDLLLSRYGTVGEVRKVTIEEDFQVSYSVAILKPVRELLSVDYIAVALRSTFVQFQIKRDVRATAQPDLGLAHIRQFVIPLPPRSEQNRIVAEVDRRLSIVRGVESEVDANLKRAQVLRQAILAKAFSGAYA